MIVPDTHIVALSGGKDSSAMALHLAEIEPREYEYVITPTGDELPEMYVHWKRLSELLGAPLRPLTSGHSLQSLVRKNKALPNWRQRWCTRVLKIEPFNTYLMEHRPAVSYVGLRADEEERQGTDLGNVEGIEQRFPLREWGWGLSEVRSYLDELGLIIPKRTDCGRCFFQRLAEWWALWREHPDVYADAEMDEERAGHTYRSPGRDSWPADLKSLRERFERDQLPRGAGQLSMFSDEREGMCKDLHTVNCLRCGSIMLRDDEDAVCPVCAHRKYHVFERQVLRAPAVEYWTVEEAAKALSMSAERIARLCKKGLIPGIPVTVQTSKTRVKMAWRIPIPSPEAMAAWRKANREGHQSGAPLLPQWPLGISDL